MTNIEFRVLFRSLTGIAIIVLLDACSTTATQPASAPSAARVVHYDAFHSDYVTPRRVTVWLPPGYDGDTDRYAVLYMHDGQNLIDPETSMGHQAWEVDRHVAQLMREGRIRKTMLVGIDNSPTRWQDYAPEQPFERLPARLQTLAIGTQGGPPHSDNYLRFLVQELKPFIDAHYRTHPDRAHTFLMGSSMGGLISLYAVARYPQVFGGAACLSTHWPYTTNADVMWATDDAAAAQIGSVTIDWLESSVPAAATHRLYFDHGTEFLDALYAPYQLRVDALFRARGYVEDKNFQTRVFQGATHNEKSWSERLDVPLSFLLRQ